MTDIRIFSTRHGPMMGLAKDIYISRSLEIYGEYCPGEAELFHQIVRPGMTVVEIGANIGAHSVVLARRCAPGVLYVFEPQQRVFQLLCANLALNGVTNVRAYPDAVGAAGGVARAPSLDYGAPGNFGGVAMSDADDGGIQVRVAALDDFHLPACHFIKVDVEGWEQHVLIGAETTIRRHRPFLYVENDRPEHKAALINQIHAMGYRMYWHRPPLFTPANFNRYPEDVFGKVVSRNLFCLPAESDRRVEGMKLVDPAEWPLAENEGDGPPG